MNPSNRRRGDPGPHTRWAICPSCRQPGEFQDSGQQRWPRAVAAAHGLPPVITLWTCPHCGTTVCETDLRP